MSRPTRHDCSFQLINHSLNHELFSATRLGIFVGRAAARSGVFIVPQIVNARKAGFTDGLHITAR